MTYRLLSYYWVMKYWIATEVSSSDNHVMGVLKEICRVISCRKQIMCFGVNLRVEFSELCLLMGPLIKSNASYD